jgi:hypothetical protein
MPLAVSVLCFSRRTPRPLVDDDLMIVVLEDHGFPLARATMLRAEARWNGCPLDIIEQKRGQIPERALEEEIDGFFNGKHSSIINMFLTDHRTPTKLQSLVLGLSLTTKYLLQLYNLSTHEKS